MKTKKKRNAKSRAEAIAYRRAEKRKSEEGVELEVKELAELTVGLKGVGSFIIEDDGIRSDS